MAVLSAFASISFYATIGIFIPFALTSEREADKREPGGRIGIRAGRSVKELYPFETMT
jgi:hypothetical protein